MFDLVTLGDYPRVIADGYEWAIQGDRVIFALWDWCAVNGVMRCRVKGEASIPLFGLLDRQRTLRRALQGGPKEISPPRPVVILQ